MTDAGFEIHEGVIGPSELADLERALESTAGRSRAGARHLMRDPAVARLAGHERLVALATGVLGAPARPYRATLFDKSPQSNWLVVWHQDTALPLRARRDVPGWGSWSTKAGILYAHAPASALEGIVALRVHLDESSHANGPLRVLPGTHRDGVLSDPEIHELAARLVPCACVAEPGSVVAMRPLLVHASSKSLGSAPRRVVHIEYAASFSMENGLDLAIA